MTVPVPPDSPQPAEDPADVDPWAPPDPGAGAAPGRGEPTVPAPAPVLGAAPGLGAAPVLGGAPGLGAAPGERPAAPYWPPYPVPAPPPRNGLGVAAMVLGIVGTALSLAVLLFWLSWLPALLALIFGIIGLGHARRGVATNRGMALAGVILGITGLVVSVGAGVFVVARVNAVNEERRAEADAARLRAENAQRAAEERAAKERERLEAARKKIEAEREAAAADERARRLAFGQSYTYADGLKVTMAAPEPYVPSETVFEAPKDATIVQVRITVVNTGSKEVSLYGSGLPFVHDAKGGLVTSLIDGSGRMKILSGSLAPGQEATGLSAYALPNNAADPFSVEFDYGSGLQRKNVIWTGAPS
ncbi:DUF4190 domain-containing protein [Kitasatospora cathayae]|uniref:DUF4190 domain-containing protein n=1 Tax=Kitasatospora cathayae TaxID=3004092 RepID=A0ABY7PWM0_9ACTN|nr:DUF4190 domain-containing protein [Kitasatospora sp. HUAS 3-15]WBP84798.1 DUF4190 domain-containing protein [Kitasatospora sp. HUAS 3-15]